MGDDDRKYDDQVVRRTQFTPVEKPNRPAPQPTPAPKSPAPQPQPKQK